MEAIPIIPIEKYSDLGDNTLKEEYGNYIVTAKNPNVPDAYKADARRRICRIKEIMKSKGSDEYRVFKGQVERVENMFYCGGIFGYGGSGDWRGMRSKRRKKRKSKKNNKSRSRTRKNRGFKKNNKKKNTKKRRR